MHLSVQKQSVVHKCKTLLPLRNQSPKIQFYAKVFLIIFNCHRVKLFGQTAADLCSSTDFEWSDLRKLWAPPTDRGQQQVQHVTPCEGSHLLVNLQVCAGVFAMPAPKARWESHIQWRILFCQCWPTSPQQSHPALLLLLKSGLQHGNENCHPVPTLIMEFRGGRHRLNHNGIKGTWEGASTRAGGARETVEVGTSCRGSGEDLEDLWFCPDKVFIEAAKEIYWWRKSTPAAFLFSVQLWFRKSPRGLFYFFWGSFCPVESLWSWLHLKCSCFTHRSLRQSTEAKY